MYFCRVFSVALAAALVAIVAAAEDEEHASHLRGHHRNESVTTQRRLQAIVTSGTYTIQDAATNRYLDAYQGTNNDVVTRTNQNNPTQRWKLQQKGAVYRLMQKSNSRYLDGPNGPPQEAYVNEEQDDDTQLWYVYNAPVIGLTCLPNRVKIQQLSTGACLDWHWQSGDYQVATLQCDINHYPTQDWGVVANVHDRDPLDFAAESLEWYWISPATEIDVGQSCDFAPPRRYLDAHPASAGYGVVTRKWQSNDSQYWELTRIGGVFTIQQWSNWQYLDAYEYSKDFQLVTRPEQNNDSQLWFLTASDDSPTTYSMRQISSLRYADALYGGESDYKVVARSGPTTASHYFPKEWVIRGFDENADQGTYDIQYTGTGRYLDADFFEVMTSDKLSNGYTPQWRLQHEGAVFTIQQKSNNRYLDASSVAGRQATTRPEQENDTQLWYVHGDSDNTLKFQQLSTGHCLDSWYNNDEDDYKVVTRECEDIATQNWRVSVDNLFESGANAHTIETAAGGRFLDAYQRSNDEYNANEFKAITRPAQDNDTQQWIFTRIGTVVSIEKENTDRFLDAYENGSGYKLTAKFQQNNDSQKWILVKGEGPKAYTMRQLSSRRFADAEGEDQVVTRLPNAEPVDTRRWILNEV